jgi:hypothetical protein
VVSVERNSGAYSAPFAVKVDHDGLFFSLPDIEYLLAHLRRDWNSRRSGTWSETDERLLLRFACYYRALYRSQGWDPESRRRIRETLRAIRTWRRESVEFLKSRR